MQKEPHRIALVGAGRMGQIHGVNAAANPRLDLAWLVEPRAKAAAELAAGLGCGVATWEEVLADPTVADAILDRLVHDAHKLSLKGESMRKVLGRGKSNHRDEQENRAVADAPRAGDQRRAGRNIVDYVRQSEGKCEPGR